MHCCCLLSPLLLGCSSLPPSSPQYSKRLSATIKIDLTEESANQSSGTRSISLPNGCSSRYAGVLRPIEEYQVGRCRSLVCGEHGALAHAAVLALWPLPWPYLRLGSFPKETDRKQEHVRNVETWWSMCRVPFLP